MRGFLNPIEKFWRWLRQEVLYLHREAADWNALQDHLHGFLAQFATGSLAVLKYVGLLGDGLLAKACRGESLPYSVGKVHQDGPPPFPIRPSTFIRMQATLDYQSSLRTINLFVMSGVQGLVVLVRGYHQSTLQLRPGPVEQLPHRSSHVSYNQEVQAH